MPKGGKRPGAGRKRGSKDKKTIAKAAVEEEYRKFMLAEKIPLWRAQRERALGAYVCLVQAKDGSYKRLTDPAQIAAVTARATRGDGYYLIEATPADVAMAKEINVRTQGVAVAPLAVTATDGGAVHVTITHQRDES